MNSGYDVNKDGIVNVVDAMAIVNEIAEEKAAAERDPLCPEFYGAKGDGLPFYDWPIRCFAGYTEEDSASIAPDANVFAPSERIKTWFEGLPKLITSDCVYYNKSKHKFLLLHDGKFHEIWGSGIELNPLSPRMDENGLNEDRLFADCSIGYFGYMDNNEPLPNVVYSCLEDRKSYVWADGIMTDIDSLMTDDYTAITACLLANKGSMKLRPNACYYMRIHKQQGDNATNPLFGVDGFKIDGQGATIFARRSDSGRIPTDKGGVWNLDVFRFSNAKNGKISNIRIKALRDRDNGAPSGHKRFSTSDSGLVAFSIVSNKDKGRWCCNLTFDNVDCRGMYEDFDIRSGSDFLVKNWRSRDVCQNFAVCKHLIVVNADVEQAPFVGTGMHLNYFGVKNCWTFNAVYRQGSPFTSVMLTHHASNAADDIHYIGCRFEGNRLAQGSFYQHQYYDNCVFSQIWRGILTDDKYCKCTSMIVGTRVNLDFDSCMFAVDGERLISTAKDDALEMTISKCGIHGRNTQDITMITGFTGILVSYGNIAEWEGKKGIEL